MQPPSRGCVLKLSIRNFQVNNLYAAAFARLCVETQLRPGDVIRVHAAAFARLCVETILAAMQNPNI